MNVPEAGPAARAVSRWEAAFHYLGVAALALTLWGRLTYLQVVKQSDYVEALKGRGLRYIPVPAPRGAIYDRNGNVLAFDETVLNVLWVGHRNVSHDDEGVRSAARILNLTQQQVLDEIQDPAIPPYLPVVLKRAVNQQTALYVLANKQYFPDLDVESAFQRRYPYGPVAAHAVGYLGEISRDELDEGREGYMPGDEIGRAGIERVDESQLRGKPGWREIVVAGRRSPARLSEDAETGGTVQLTLDVRIQQIAYDALARHRGAVVVADAASGEIIALVSTPSFDPNAFIRDDLSEQRQAYLEADDYPLINRAIQAAYPPGSTFKIVTGSAALDLGKIDADSLFTCHGQITVGNRIFRCWQENGHGTINTVSSIAQSCDVAFYQIGLRVGPELLAAYARKFGYGQKTGIELPEERAGVLPSPGWKRARRHEPWFQGDTLNLSIGQGYLAATPVQVLQSILAIANGGQIPPLHLTRKVGNDDYLPPAGKPVPVSEQAIEVMKKGLRQAVLDGTARGAGGTDAEVYGKTGTAEADNRVPYSWFVSWFHKGDRSYVAVAVAEGGGHGSSTAVPIIRRIWDNM